MKRKFIRHVQIKDSGIFAASSAKKQSADKSEVYDTSLADGHILQDCYLN